MSVTKRGRAVAVVMSMEHYERLQGAAWARLTATMDSLGAEAAGSGLTDPGLEALLADQSDRAVLETNVLFSVPPPYGVAQAFRFGVCLLRRVPDLGTM